MKEITLEKMFNGAKDFAEDCLRQRETVPPMHFFYGVHPVIEPPPGQKVFSCHVMAIELDTAENKKRVASTIAFTNLANGSTHSLFMCEMWLSCNPLFGGGKAGDFPKDDPHRKRVIMFIGESIDGPLNRALPVIQSDNGNFFGFGEDMLGAGYQIAGIFCGLLPKPGAAPEIVRYAAKIQLEALGAVLRPTHKVYQKGTIPDEIK